MMGDDNGKLFLAQKVVYEGKPSVGFIIKRSDKEWDYGLLEQKDSFISGTFQLNDTYLGQVIKPELDNLHKVWNMMCLLYVVKKEKVENSLGQLNLGEYISLDMKHSTYPIQLWCY